MTMCKIWSAFWRIFLNCSRSVSLIVVLIMIVFLYSPKPTKCSISSNNACRLTKTNSAFYLINANIKYSKFQPIFHTFRRLLALLIPDIIQSFNPYAVAFAYKIQITFFLLILFASSFASKEITNISFLAV